jgi:predicted small metal-binding protein
VKKILNCPCGWSASAESDDDLVSQVQQHAKEAHDQNPSREEILSMAKPA